MASWSEPSWLGEAPALDDDLTEVLQTIDHGYLWLDHRMKVRGYNRACRELLGFDHDREFIGRSYEDFLEYLFERPGVLGNDDHATHAATDLAGLRYGEKAHFERVRANGGVLKISLIRLKSGGYVCACLDITRERRALEEVKRNAKATVVAMANFSEHRDTDTGVHVLRVSRLTGQTARQLQRNGRFAGLIDDDFIDHVSTASILHDVGKIATPDRILLKAGPLDESERLIMKQHALAGSQMLKQAGLVMSDSRYLHIGAEIALTHHEWFDGSGYPKGLKGDDIPLSGRICALADVFDALTSRRPYKAPWTIEQAMALIRQQAGTQFDPVVAEAFLDVVEECEKVKLVQWSDTMSVGSQHIDEQHRLLIDTINQLASAKYRNDRSLVAIIIDELISYAVFHFDYECRVMEEAAYPELASHRRTHDGFVKWIKDLRDDFTYHRRDQIDERILGFLRTWLSEHILGEDQKYRSYIDGNS